MYIESEFITIYCCPANTPSNERIIIIPNVFVNKATCNRTQQLLTSLGQRSRNKGNVGSCWLKSLTGFQLRETTCNRVCKRTQHVISNNLASVCTKLNVKQTTLSHSFLVVAYAWSIILSEFASRVTPTGIVKRSVKESFSTKEAETYGRNYKLFASGNN